MYEVGVRDYESVLKCTKLVDVSTKVCTCVRSGCTRVQVCTLAYEVGVREYESVLLYEVCT